MPLIQDPDLLVDATELTINTAAKTITLNVAGNLSADGATGQALYSKLKELWRTNATYIKFPFPMESITPEQFEFISGWTPANDATRKLLRRCGWAERTAAGAITREYAGIISLGSMSPTDQPYYQQDSAGAAVDFTYPDVVDEAVQIYGDAGNGNFTRKTFFKLFLREQSKTYASADLAAIGVVSLTYIAYRFPLGNASDLKIQAADGAMTGAPYSSILATYFGVNQNRNIGGTNYPFRIIIDGANATAEQIYTKVQFLLRQNADIDAGAGSVIGDTANDLLYFVGDTLKTRQGVFIDNYNANDINRIVFTDQNAVERIFPFTASGVLQFNGNLVADASAKYWLFFEALPGAGNDFGEAGAVIVNDSVGNPIEGNVGGLSSIAFTFAYDTNTQGGRTAATDATVRLVVLGLATAQYAPAVATISRSNGQSISVTSGLERNYVNP
ncbi:MAG: Synechococcus virus Syn5 [Deinococcota bacterium]|jgi:hypothetical protein